MEYEPITADFLDTINMKDYSSRVDNLDVNEIFKIINKMYLEIDTIQSALCNNMNRVKEEQLKYVNLILSEL